MFIEIISHKGSFSSFLTISLSSTRKLPVIYKNLTNTLDKEVKNTKQKQQQQQQSSCNRISCQFCIFRICGKNGICRICGIYQACRICLNIFFGSKTEFSENAKIAAIA
jgi:hypothetical protein